MCANMPDLSGKRPKTRAFLFAVYSPIQASIILAAQVKRDVMLSYKQSEVGTLRSRAEKLLPQSAFRFASLPGRDAGDPSLFVCAGN